MKLSDMDLKPGDVLWRVCPWWREMLSSARVKSVSPKRVVFEDDAPATGFCTHFGSEDDVDLYRTREKAILAYVGRMRVEASAAQDRLAKAERLLAEERGK